MAYYFVLGIYGDYTWLFGSRPTARRLKLRPAARAHVPILLYSSDVLAFGLASYPSLCSLRPAALAECVSDGSAALPLGAASPKGAASPSEPLHIRTGVRIE